MHFIVSSSYNEKFSSHLVLRECLFSYKSTKQNKNIFYYIKIISLKSSSIVIGKDKQQQHGDLLFLPNKICENNVKSELWTLCVKCLYEIEGKRWRDQNKSGMENNKTKRWTIKMDTHDNSQRCLLLQIKQEIS